MKYLWEGLSVCVPEEHVLANKEEVTFQKLIRSSTLFCFTSNLADLTGDVLKGRKIIPITDEKANVTYHLLYKKKKNWKNNKGLFAE